MNKIIKFLVSMFLGIFWIVIWNILPTIVCAGLFLSFGHPYEVPVIMGYFMVMLFYCFHEATFGTWIGYLEGGFLPVFCIIEVWLWYARNDYPSTPVFFDFRFVSIILLAMLLSSFLYKKKDANKNGSKIAKISKSIFVVLLGLYCYLGVATFGTIIFEFEIMMKVLPVFVIAYTVIAQKILKRGYRWKLLISFIVIFSFLLLKACVINMEEICIYGLESFLIPNVLYGIAVAIGELIVWLSDKRKDSRLAKQEAEDMESDWYLRF